MELTILSFWAINAPLNAEALNRQMDDLRRLGMDGVVFHPRHYPGKPAYLSQEYMDILSNVILHAKDTGMIFWLYDENGWPSGTAGGQMMALHPEFRIRMLNERLEVLEEPGINVLEFGVADAFLTLTHERYRVMLAPEAFDYVTGFFTDEAAFCSHGCSISSGCVPWCADMPERFRSKALFEPAPDGEALRKEYWAYVAELMQQRFYLPIRRWCEQHGKQFTGHLKGEENPYFSVSFCGSAVSSLLGFTLPGVDALERYMRNSCFPRLPVSVSLQFGDGHALCEAMGGSGWGTRPQDEEAYLLGLAEKGIDTFVMHLQQFVLNEESKADWPPSRPCDLTWSEAYPEMLRRVRKKAAAMNPIQPADVLIIMPARGTMAGFLPSEARGVNEHDGDELPDVPAARNSLSLLQLTDAFHRNGWRYDLTDEWIYEQNAVCACHATQIGKRSYSCVIKADGADLARNTENTPGQTGWEIIAYEGEKRVPSKIQRKDERHFLCEFDKAGASLDDPGNLIAAGYGFCKNVRLKKRLYIEHAWSPCTLLFTGIDASAACVYLDDKLLGFIYGQDWSLSCERLEQGEHAVELILYNSGYNVYGPHHYYLGDAPLTSPLHYQGVKHFGDPPDAPEHTHAPAWHFVNYYCFGQIHLLKQPIRREEK